MRTSLQAEMVQRGDHAAEAAGHEQRFDKLEQGVAADDRDNLRIRFGDWLEYAAARFRELLPEKRALYTDEKVRQILRGLMPALERYRFLRKMKPSADESVSEAETIWECLPALWHYQAAQLAEPISGSVEAAKTEQEVAE